MSTAASTSPGSQASSESAARSVVASLTDEEIDVLCDGDHHVVVLPHLSLLGEQETRSARRVAERSLAARGLLLPGSDGGHGGADDRADRTVAVHELLAPLLQMRRGAPVVVVLHRTPTADLASTGTSSHGPGGDASHRDPVDGITATAPGTPSSLTRYLFVLDGACVCEDVTAQGVHTLSMARVAHLAELLTELLVPPGACAPPGSATIVGDPTDLPWTLHRLGHPTVLAESTVLHPWLAPGQAPARLLVLGPGGCYHAALGEVSRWVCRPVSPEDLVRLLVAEVGAAARRVEQESTGHNGGRD
ncbi:MAG: hypothetical protein ACR2FV_11775 [Ornithinimicrobium sp.]|uniref:hypothetical protein n=1 Tax=Ornithinimicrobium sp. TaxID=1977084 RepID=UPI003D9AEDD9